mgnify:CR=1 FL=1
MFGMGLRVAVLTGDTPAAARAALEATKIDTARVDVRASCAPPDKLAYVNACMDGGAGVLIVGDCVNDAPALAAASVGVAQALEARGASVDNKVNLGGTSVNRDALLSDNIDVYPEYNGTGWTVHLGNEDPSQDPQELYDVTAEADLEQNDIKWVGLVATE